MADCGAAKIALARSATSPTCAPLTFMTTTFSRPSEPCAGGKPSNPRSDSNGNRRSRTEVTPRTSASARGTAMTTAGAGRISCTAARSRANSWPATSNVTSIDAASTAADRCMSATAPLLPRDCRGARACCVNAAPSSFLMSSIFTTASWLSERNAPLSCSPCAALSSDSRTSMRSSATATKASTDSTASARWVPASSTMAFVAAAAAEALDPSSSLKPTRGSTVPRRFAMPSNEGGLCGTRATTGIWMTSKTYPAGSA